MKAAAILVVLSLCFVQVALAEKMVVVPIGGAVGDATPADVVKGKTFSCSSGKGLTGTLDLNGECTGDAEASDVLVGKTFSNATGTGLSGTLEVREGSKIYLNSIGMKFSLIPAGSFIIGSPDGSVAPAIPEEAGREMGETQHRVTITRGFYMQTTEVTQRQWLELMGYNPSFFTGCGLDCPVESVSWDDTKDFIAVLNAREGNLNCNTANNICYTLPSEAQWEYAARAGTVTANYNGDVVVAPACSRDLIQDRIAWHCGNNEVTYTGCADYSIIGGASCAGTHPVAQKVANNWGLYDIFGNVSEWCHDYYDTYPNDTAVDPTGPYVGNMRVVRGGGWETNADALRSAKRYGAVPHLIGSGYGFRLVLPVPPDFIIITPDAFN